MIITAKGMNIMRRYYARFCDYYESLQTETAWLKLFVPYFLWLTFYLVVLFPIIKYIIEVLIKHKEYSGNNIVYAIAVSLFFSVVFKNCFKLGGGRKKRY